jgi:serine/threonine protein kinase
MAHRRLIPGGKGPASHGEDSCASLPCSARKGGTDVSPDVTSPTLSVLEASCQTADGRSNSTEDLLAGLREKLKEFGQPCDTAAHTRYPGNIINNLNINTNNKAEDKMQIVEAEIDSRDTPAAIEPLHIVGTLDDLPPARSIVSKLSRPAPVTPRKPRLTLSAFRRPEETVRLTDCDASRLLENEYNLRAPECRVIGHGAFSTVRLAIRLTDGEKVAVKSLSKYDALRSRRLRRGGPRHMDEWEIMRKLKNNPFVLSLLDVFETDEEIHLVTEYCEGGELFDAIKRKGSKRNSFRISRYSEAQAARITSQILEALKGLHSHNIVHRDIKAENILLLNKDESDIQVKLADFGVARLHCETAETGSDGESSPATPGLVYSTNSPPETCMGASGPASDVYALGVTLYILLCGFPPVFCDDVVVFPDAYWSDISDQAKAIVRNMLNPSPCHRTTVAAALAEPWVRQQTTRVRRGSISANLELVKSRLFQVMGEPSANPKKRSRCSSLTLSPMKRRLSIDESPMKRGVSTDLGIAMTDLYAATKKKARRTSDDEMMATQTSLVSPKVSC